MMRLNNGLTSVALQSDAHTCLPQTNAGGQDHANAHMLTKLNLKHRQNNVVTASPKTALGSE